MRLVYSLLSFLLILELLTGCTKGLEDQQKVASLNKYDGIYHLKIKGTGWIDFGISDSGSVAWPDSIFLITLGPDSVAFGNGQPISASGVYFTLAATQPVFTFDSTTDYLVDVRNNVPDDGRSRVFQLNPAVKDSRYDAVGRIIYAAYIMAQTGRPDEYFYDTLTYNGPR